MLLLILNRSDDPVAGVIALIVFLLVCLIGLAIYFLPTAIAMLRSHPNIMPIFLVNFLLGGICVGWIVALIWSVTAIDKSKSYR